MLATYLVDAAEAGVDLYSNSPGRDSLALSSFDSTLLEEHTEAAGVSPAKRKASELGSELALALPPPAAKKRKLMLPAGCGDGWT